MLDNQDEKLKPVIHIPIKERTNAIKVEGSLGNSKSPVLTTKNEVEFSSPSSTKKDRRITRKEDTDNANANTHDKKNTKTNVRRSNTTNVIAGNVNSGLGSPKNFATDFPQAVDDGKWQKSIKSAIYYSSELLNDDEGLLENKRPSMTKINMELRRSFYSLNRNNNGDIQIPIKMQSENPSGYPDSRVAYRLASNEFLYKN